MSLPSAALSEAPPATEPLAHADAARPDPAAPPSDEHLLARFLKGDRDALGALATRYERPMLGLACALLRGRQDLAPEAAQECWLRVIKYGRSFKNGATVRTWLYRILINTCKDAAASRSRLRFPSTSTDALPADPPAPAVDGPDAERLAALHAALERLTPDQKLLVILCYHHGLTHPQAADVLGIPPGTVKSRLHAGLTKLREHLAVPDTDSSAAAANQSPASPVPSA